MAVEVLGRRVYNNVRTELQGVLQSGGGKGVVADDEYFGVVFVCGLGKKLNVGDLEVGVCGGLEINGDGVLTKVCREIFKLAEVRERDLDAVLRHAVAEQGEGTAVESLVGDDVLSCARNAPQAGGDGAHAGGGCCARLTAFKSCDLVFQNGGGGVAETGVDVTAFLARKTHRRVYYGKRNA